MQLVSFFNADLKISIKNKGILKDFIPFVFVCERKKLKKLSVISCTDEFLLSLNNQYLNRDYYTDILTFDLSEDENIVGEIYISIDRILENSVLNNVSFEQEFNRIIIHGSLHLCGYLDKSAKEKEHMCEMENFYLQELLKFHVKQK